MSDNSVIKYSDGHTAFVGPDAVAFYRATVIACGLRLYANARIRPNRHWTPTAMLAAASQITGKRYKRGEYLKASDDVTEWARTMKAALPVVDNTTKG